jgi:lipopolysaccharide/colanic/teichoic acid biosynthesis glycosyltransferase
MSLVGPRPHQPKEVKNYTNEQRKLLLIKPGITGLAQISGRSDLTFDEEARLDIFYLENWSIWLDFYIILKTFSAVFRGKGTY